MDAGTVSVQGVETALERLDLPAVDVMQFHWWRYEDPTRYLDALGTAHARLREEGSGPRDRADQFRRCPSAPGSDQARAFEIASNQVCFLAAGPAGGGGPLSDVARRARRVALLAFGTLGRRVPVGAFAGSRTAGAGPDFADWSRMKYKRFVDAAGGWAVFQGLLAGARRAWPRKHEASVSNVVTSLGARASEAVTGDDRRRAARRESEHRADNLRAPGRWIWTHEDQADHFRCGGWPDLIPVPGDCGDEYRKPPFLTASGDLSDHLDAMPPVFPVVVHARRVRERVRAESGSIWEERAGFCPRDAHRAAASLVSGTTATAPQRRGGICPR
jgi:hypothetical protein